MGMINDLLLSLKKGDDGYSGAKISAFMVMFLICYGHLNYIDKVNWNETLWTDVVFVLTLFGILKAERIVELFAKIKGVNIDDDGKDKDPSSTKS